MDAHLSARNHLCTRLHGPEKHVREPTYGIINTVTNTTTPSGPGNTKKNTHHREKEPPSPQPVVRQNALIFSRFVAASKCHNRRCVTTISLEIPGDGGRYTYVHAAAANNTLLSHRSHLSPLDGVGLPGPHRSRRKNYPRVLFPRRRSHHILHQRICEPGGTGARPISRANSPRSRSQKQGCAKEPGCVSVPP